MTKKYMIYLFVVLLAICIVILMIFSWIVTKKDPGIDKLFKPGSGMTTSGYLNVESE